MLHFPKDKGDARWHQKADRLFLGIDHTAVVGADPETSLAFFRDRLGLKVAGESENHGTEQEHLSNVFGARLRITTLRATKGPGIELLEYLTPRDGRPAPPVSRANDLWHWQVRLHAVDVDEAARALRGGPLRLVSPGAITLTDDQLGYSEAVLGRDPDEHALLFTAK